MNSSPTAGGFKPEEHMLATTLIFAVLSSTSPGPIYPAASSPNSSKVIAAIDQPIPIQALEIQKRKPPKPAKPKRPRRPITG